MLILFIKKFILSIYSGNNKILESLLRIYFSKDSSIMGEEKEKYVLIREKIRSNVFVRGCTSREKY